MDTASPTGADVTGAPGPTGSPAPPATAIVDPLTPPAIDAPAGAPGDAAASTGVVPPARLIEERFASPQAYTPKHLAEKILVSASAIEGERKQVTVVFTDVSGFTSLASRLDPEAVHEIMDRLFEIVLASVHAYEGTVNQFLGDGVMALFGAPIAHEDHAHRALRAALGIRAGLVPLRDHVQQRHGIDFRVRIGINTGPVVVGAIGRDLRMDYTAVGDTTNLASRILNIAGSGQIALSANTHRLTDGYFDFDDLGEFQVKGKDEPIRVWTVSAEISGRTRLAVSRERGLTPLIGRDRELVRLATGYRQAANGYGAIVVVVGEPGVGKSRLIYEFLRRLDGQGILELEGTGVSYGHAIPYRPILELVRRYLALKEGMPGEEIRQRVVYRLRALGIEGEEPAVLLAHFLGVPAPQPILNRLSGAQLKERTFGVLRDLFLRASREAPIVLVVENIHWLDPSSEEFVQYFMRALPGHRVLLVLSGRPGFAPPWLVALGADTLTLQGLGDSEIRHMTRSLVHANTLAAPLVKILDDKSEGNPLYVEEILRELQETAGIIVERGEARLRSADVAVPATIHDIIAARVDRLTGSLKRTLQGAAVIGRRSGVSLLSRVLESPPQQTIGQLGELHRLDFIFPAAPDPEPTYSFKHALTQDVVYGGLLERRRRQYHFAAGLGSRDALREPARRRGGAPRVSLRPQRGVREGGRLRDPRRREGTEAVGDHRGARAVRERAQAPRDHGGQRGQSTPACRHGAQAVRDQVRAGPPRRARPGARGDPRARRDLRRSCAPGRLALLDRVPPQPHRRPPRDSHRPLPEGRRDRREGGLPGAAGVRGVLPHARLRRVRRAQGSDRGGGARPRRSSKPITTRGGRAGRCSASAWRPTRSANGRAASSTVAGWSSTAGISTICGSRWSGSGEAARLTSSVVPSLRACSVARTPSPCRRSPSMP